MQHIHRGHIDGVARRFRLGVRMGDVRRDRRIPLLPTITVRRVPSPFTDIRRPTPVRPNSSAAFTLAKNPKSVQSAGDCESKQLISPAPRLLNIVSRIDVYVECIANRGIALRRQSESQSIRFQCQRIRPQVRHIASSSMRSEAGGG